MDALTQLQEKVDELACVFLSSLAQVVQQKPEDGVSDEHQYEEARSLAKTLVVISQDIELLIEELPDISSTPKEEQTKELLALDEQAREMTEKLRQSVLEAENRAEKIRGILQSLAHDCIHSSTLASSSFST
eukprot:TRINITY_DN8131_c0_g1_i1.p1 TRINITY_DN8131_c0_g1~~TRINITY_DN8131_c0_g1_i1.p1  ORF type:complete len:132 (+),score=24.87 TRINITY_DN8131_c0_g1_i1:162-557(+)